MVLPSNPPKSTGVTWGKMCKTLESTAKVSAGRRFSPHREIERAAHLWMLRWSREESFHGNWCCWCAAGELLELVPLVGLGLFLTPPPDLIVRCSQHDTTGTSRDRPSARQLLTHAPLRSSAAARRHHDNYRSASTYEHQRCLIFSCASPTDFCPGRFLLQPRTALVLPAPSKTLFALSHRVGEKQRERERGRDSAPLCTHAFNITSDNYWSCTRTHTS